MGSVVDTVTCHLCRRPGMEIISAPVPAPKPGPKGFDKIPEK